MLKISSVVPGETAAKLGLVPGDCIIDINGTSVNDLVDFGFEIAEEYVSIRVKKRDGRTSVYKTAKDFGDDLGLEFAVAPRRCTNSCIFCFVDQQPPGLRDTVYIKDDDYRLSFLSGNYVTLTNLRPGETERIIRQRLTPLYVSVHATDAEVRGRMLGLKHPSDIINTMRALAAAGIDFHTQVVLCPGINDGAVLEKTISDLVGLGNRLLSLAIVPVGLTRHRDGLYHLEPVDGDLARQVIADVDRWQEKMLAASGRRMVYAADEFYVVAGIDVPEDDYYEDYSQLENGVGLIRRTLNQAERLRARRRAKAGKNLTAVLVTGQAAFGTWRNIAPLLEEKLPGLKVEVRPVKNHLLGPQVTVAGLLAGGDIGKDLAQMEKWDVALIPEVCLRAGEFIDGISLERLGAKLKRPLLVAEDLLDAYDKLKKEVNR